VPEPSASTAAALPTPAPADIEEIEALHEEVLRATAACDGSPFTGRRQLRAALKHQDRALRQIGCSSYTDFAMLAHVASRGGRTQSGPAEDNGASRAEPAAPAPPVSEPVAETPASAWVTEIPAVPSPEADRTEEIRRELEETRLALRLSQDEVAHTRADLADAIAVRDAAGTSAEIALAELQQERDRAETASAEAANATRKLSDALVEVERHRQALAEAAATRSADGAHRELLEDLEQRVAREQGARVTAEAESLLATEQLATVRSELDELRQRAGTTTDLEAQLAALRDDAARVVDEANRFHDARRAELESQLAAAHELAAQAGTEVERAVRSRDAAVDEVAARRTQLDELGAELAAVRSELAQARKEQEQAALAATAATAGREAQLTEQVERATAELAAMQRAAAAADEQFVAAQADATARLAGAHDGLESARAENAELTEALACARAEVSQATDALTEARAEVTQLTDALTEAQQEPEPRPDPAPLPGVDDLARLAELARARAEAEEQLTEVEGRVAQLQEKRRRLKRRIEQQRTRFTAERVALERELGWSREQVGARLATMEHHVEAVTTDAETLRAQLAAVRATLPPGHQQDDPDGPGARS
jgi:chromosome segregation ATPase